MAVQAARSGLFFAIDLRRDMPAEWHKLKTTGKVDILIAKCRLPWLAQAHGATISHTAFSGRADGNPPSLAIKFAGTNVTLAAPSGSPSGSPIVESAFSNAVVPAIDSSPSIEIATQTDRDNLQDLMLIAKLDLVDLLP